MNFNRLFCDLSMLHSSAVLNYLLGQPVYLGLRARKYHPIMKLFYCFM